MYINISYKFHRIPDRQSRFITKVHDLLGQPLYIACEDPEGGGGGGETGGRDLPRKSQAAIGFLRNTGMDPLEKL